MVLIITIKDGIVDEALSYKDDVKRAEDKFTKKALELGAEQQDIDTHLEDGYFSIANASVCIVHPWNEED